MGWYRAYPFPSVNSALVKLMSRQHSGTYLVDEVLHLHDKALPVVQPKLVVRVAKRSNKTFRFRNDEH